MNSKIFIMLFLAFALNIQSKDVNKLNKDLIEAVSDNNISKVQELINSGASVNIQEYDGQTPLYFSIQSKDNKIIKMLLTDIVKLLLELGANPNTKDVQGNEALHIAVSSNNKEIVKMLIEAGASISGQDEQNNTPLELAIARHNSEIAKLLRSVNIVESNLSKLKDQQEDIKATLVKRWINQYLRHKDEKLITRLQFAPKCLLRNIIGHMLKTLKQSKAISQDDAIRINKKESMLKNLLFSINKRIAVGFEDVNIITQDSKKRLRENVEFEKLKKKN